MDLLGWDIRIEDLSLNDGRGWSYKCPIPLRESQDGKYAFVFYDCVEYAMGWVASDLAVMTDKKDAKIIFDSRGFKFRHTFTNDFVFAEKSSVAILIRHCYDQAKSISADTYCLLDFNRRRFAILSFVACEFYRMKEVDEDVLQLILAYPDDLKRYEERENRMFKKYEGTNILLPELTWIALAELNNYNTIYCSSPELFTLN